MKLLDKYKEEFKKKIPKFLKPYFYDDKLYTSYACWFKIDDYFLRGFSMDPEEGFVIWELSDNNYAENITIKVDKIIKNKDINKLKDIIKDCKELIKKTK